jgi:hypothetical protein
MYVNDNGNVAANEWREKQVEFWVRKNYAPWL